MARGEEVSELQIDFAARQSRANPESQMYFRVG